MPRQGRYFREWGSGTRRAAAAPAPIAPGGAAVDAGPSMGFAWRGGSNTPAWTVGLACKANGQAVTRWMLYNERSMQNCVFPGRAPLVLRKDQTLRLQETLVIRPASRKKTP